MIAREILLSLLLAIGAQGWLVHGMSTPAPTDLDNEPRVHTRDERLVITPEYFGTAAAESREGKVRLARVKRLMQDVRAKWPSSGLYFNKKHKENDCFFSHHPQRALDSTKAIKVRILANPIKSLSGGQVYTTEETTTKTKTTFKGATYGASESKSKQSSWQAGAEFSLGPLGEWLSFGLAGKWSTETTHTEGSSTSDTTENSDQESVAVKKGRKVTCPADHTCDLQSWTYQATFYGKSPVIPAVDLACIWDHTTGDRDVIGTLPWQVPRNSLADIGKYCEREQDESIQKMEDGDLGRVSDYELTLLRPLAWPLWHTNCRMYRGENGNPDYAHFLGKIAMELIDRKLGSWASSQEGPKFYKLNETALPEEGHAVPMSKWLYQNRVFQYDPQAQDPVQYLQHEDWSWDFPVRNPDSSLMHSTVLVKTPYSTASKRSEEEGTTIDIIDEDMDLDILHYAFANIA
ncbi:hypothetical protein MAC_09659 [Metarhizium acridum CQMa 102]|uniref:Uncharacterized protein n=1 Tax=Metarhizium acridum (strain CQMa 102) TaxID=655827 RepID=E9EIG1_METAQ|nr:uncharacterized protein MAC_09659 [Metarhizium acridum CQMa 102]EFY84291.1 hypothetical protein MAC_09659 [Metarhizium acridum CQMa 102]